MTELFTPHTGLMVWTIITFGLLVLILGKFGWKPLIQALNDREAGIRRAIEDAQAAKVSADQLKLQYEKELAQGQAKAQAMLAQTASEAQKIREKLLKDAEAEAQRLSEMNRRQLEEEKNNVLRDVRKEIASLSVRAAEKLVRHTMNQNVQDDLLKEFFEDLEKGKN